VREALGYAQREVLVLGDGANDLAMMAEAGVSIAYRAKPVVRNHATYALSHVGLEGVLRLFP
jgi:phosphoserine phosphatase